MIHARDELTAILVAAYSGEQAAALAYHGHWRSCAEPDEREAIRRIEDDEWRHRRVVGRMLERLGAFPSPRREVRSRIVGRVLGLLCGLAGRRLPMLAAGRLECRNVFAYDEAASLAEAGNLPEMVGELREMAEVEREHERYFRAKVAGRPASLARKVAALRETTPEAIGDLTRRTYGRHFRRAVSRGARLTTQCESVTFAEASPRATQAPSLETKPSMADSSFDVVSSVDLQEVKNAIAQAAKEIQTRFDLKNSGSSVDLQGEEILLASSDEFKLKAVKDVLEGRLVKRNVPLKALSFGTVEQALGGTVRQRVALQKGIPTEKAREIVKLIKSTKLKVQAAIQGEQVRVSGKNKDDLQAVMQLLRSTDLGIDMQFTNRR